MVKCCVFFAVRTEFLNIIQTSFGFKGLKYLLMVESQSNSIGLINTHIAVTIQEPLRQLSSNSPTARMSFSQVQRVFIVEHYLASRSYLICQNEFRDTFPEFSCAKQIDNISSGEPFPRHRNSSPGCIKHEEKNEWMHRWTRWTFPTRNITLFLFSNFNLLYFFDR
jgi:hypothetical protein